MDDRGRWLDAPVLVARLGAVAYLSVIVSLLFWSHAPALVGWQPRVVVSGSMLPTIRPGDVALIGPATSGRVTLPPGHIVLVRDPTRSTGYYLHRVVRYDASGDLVTRGDANGVDDYPAVKPDQVAGQLRLLVPVIGLPMLWWQDHAWVRLGAVGGAAWAALLLAFERGGVRSTGARSS